MERITPEQLRAGDILLSMGASDISKLIAVLDEGKYSHASYYKGDRKIIHATTADVVEADIAFLDNPDYKYVDVYRLNKQEHPSFGGVEKALGDKGFPVDSVNNAANCLKGKPYDYASAVLLSWLLWDRDDTSLWAIGVALRFGWSVVRKKIRDELKKATDALEMNDQKKAMTCTEVVTTSYDDANRSAGKLSGLYELHFVNRRRKNVWLPERLGAVQRTLSEDEFSLMLRESGAELGEVSVSEALQDYVQIMKDCREITAQFMAQPESIAETAFLPGTLGPARAGSRNLPLNLVSPEDMRTSTSLHPKGRLFPLG